MGQRGGGGGGGGPPAVAEGCTDSPAGDGEGAGLHTSLE